MIEPDGAGGVCLPLQYYYYIFLSLAQHSLTQVANVLNAKVFVCPVKLLHLLGKRAFLFLVGSRCSGSNNDGLPPLLKLWGSV